MKKLLLTILPFMMVVGAWACNPQDPAPATEISGQPGEDVNTGGSNKPGTDSELENMTVVIKIGSAAYTATLAENATAKAFRELLPMTVTMKDLNSNEKYHDLQDYLPTEVSSPGTIHAGDIMLYGSRTLVLFYKTFKTSYGYTRIGSVNDPEGLERKLGSGSIEITFENNN